MSVSTLVETKNSPFFSAYSLTFLMTRFVYLFASIVLLASVTCSCIDHQPGGPLSPTRSRLVRIENLTNQQTTVYTYDKANRPASFSVSDGSTGQYVYDDAVKKSGRLTFFDPLTKETNVTQFPDPAGQQSFSTVFYGRQTDVPTPPLYSVDYGLDDKYQLTTVTLMYGGQFTNGVFVSQGNNVVSSSVNTMRFRSRYTYTHDTKINPFYGFMGATIYPYNPISIRFNAGLPEALQFSRNNITEIAEIDGSGVTTYTYTYNSEGLPLTKSANGQQQYRFTYEQY
jgi:hypothetical protein